MKTIRKMIIWILASPILLLVWPAKVIIWIDAKMVEELDYVSDGVLLFAAISGEAMWILFVVWMISRIL